MATRTSTQSGNFNATSTWGGSAVPVDGDQFVVAAGHIVTVNDDRRTTNGYHDSTINGKLHITGSGKLRMNGNLLLVSTNDDNYFAEGSSSTGAYYKMDNGAILEMRGSNADNHRFESGNYKRNWVEIDGDTPYANTTLSAAMNVGDTSMSVASSSGFAAGEWINCWELADNIDDYEIDGMSFEGFIVHDISGNTIYTRRYVSPNSEIVKSASNKIFVQNSKVFRLGQKIIFGTGSNRNIHTVTNINKVTHKITLDGTVTGSVVGEIAYYTGAEKHHLSGDQVEKRATPLLVDVASGTRTVQVASTDGMAVGKRILIEANNPNDHSWDYEMLYEIESIPNSTSVVLTENLANNRKAGGWVQIFDRDTQIRGADLTDTDQAPYCLLHKLWTSGSAYYRKLRLKNCLFDGMGGQSSNTSYNRGLFIGGLMSYEKNSYAAYPSEVAGCVHKPSRVASNAGTITRYWHQGRIRNHTVYDTQGGFYRWSTGNHHQLNGIMSWRSDNYTFGCDGLWGNYSELAYNHTSRADDYGLFIHHCQTDVQVRHNVCTHHEQRPFYNVYEMKNVVSEFNYFDYYRYWPYHHPRGGDWIHLNSYLGNHWDTTIEDWKGDGSQVINGTFISSADESRFGRGNGTPTTGISINHNFEQDELVEWSNYGWRTWDEDEGAFFNRRTLSTNGTYAGFHESVFVPAGATAYVSGEIKMSSGYTGTRPYLGVRNNSGDYHNGRYRSEPTKTSYLSSADSVGVKSGLLGFLETSQFTTAADSAYERVTITVAPQDYDYFLGYGIVTTSTNLANGNEGYYSKPLEVSLTNKSKGASRSMMPTNSALSTVKRGNSGTVRKTRLGGRLK